MSRLSDNEWAAGVMGVEPRMVDCVEDANDFRELMRSKKVAAWAKGRAVQTSESGDTYEYWPNISKFWLIWQRALHDAQFHPRCTQPEALSELREAMEKWDAT